ncbi:MAG: APC family permease [Thermoplasmataceae archaeon]
MVDSEKTLRRGTLSLWEAFAQGLGTNGPAAVTALFFVSLAGIVAGSLPLVVTLAFVIYLGMTLIAYEWSKEVASAYSWAAYHRRGFKRAGRFLSFYAGTTYYYYYLLGYTGFAVLGLSSFLYVIFPGIASAYPWIWMPITIAVILETSILNYFGIKPSMRYVLYTGIAEIAFLLLTSIALIALNPGKVSIIPYTTQPISGNLSTLLVAMVLGIATFGGLNTVVPVAEETKDPKRNVPLALALLAGILGLTIILNCYSQTISYGVANMINYANIPDPGIFVYTTYLGVIVAGIFAVFIANSFNSSGVSFETAAVRTSYAFSRDGILFPSSLSKINKHGVPGRMVIFNATLATIIALVSGIVLGPLTAGVFLIISNSIFSLSNHAIAGIGLIFYHGRRKTLRIVVHVIIPILVSIAIAIAIFYTVYPAPPVPLNYSAWIAGIFLACIIIAYILYRRQPEKLDKVGEFSL